MSQIDNVLLLLIDGKWHNLIEVARMLGLTHENLEKTVELLKEFNFIYYKKNMIRISSDVKELMESLSREVTK